MLFCSLPVLFFRISWLHYSLWSAGQETYLSGIFLQHYEFSTRLRSFRYMSLFSSWSSTSAGLVGNSRVRFGQGSPSRVAVDRPLDTLKPLIPPPPRRPQVQLPSHQLSEDVFVQEESQEFESEDRFDSQLSDRISSIPLRWDSDRIHWYCLVG